MVLAPSPAVVKQSRRTTGHEGSRGGSREHISVQPLAPASRRASQQRLEGRERDSALISQHPYATAPTQTYRNTAYGRNSPVQKGLGQLPNGTGTSTAVQNSDSYMYGTPQQGKANGYASREGTPANGVKEASGVRGTNVYEQQAQMTPMDRVGEQDDHGDGRKRGFWAAFCCRA